MSDEPGMLPLASAHDTRTHRERRRLPARYHASFAHRTISGMLGEPLKRAVLVVTVIAGQHNELLVILVFAGADRTNNSAGSNMPHTHTHIRVRLRWCARKAQTGPLVAILQRSH
eukprot:1180999-Prorocentrum_minimum.AAC.1